MSLKEKEDRRSKGSRQMVLVMTLSHIADVFGSQSNSERVRVYVCNTRRNTELFCVSSSLKPGLLPIRLTSLCKRVKVVTGSFPRSQRLHWTQAKDALNIEHLWNRFSRVCAYTCSDVEFKESVKRGWKCCCVSSRWQLHFQQAGHFIGLASGDNGLCFWSSFWWPAGGDVLMHREVCLHADLWENEPPSPLTCELSMDFSDAFMASVLYLKSYLKSRLAYYGHI